MPAGNGLDARVRQRLADLQAHGLLRRLRPPSGIDLSSNDYLALASHPRLVHALAAAVRAHGAGSTGSRLLRGDREAFTAVEARFAAFKNTARALFFSSGYLANIAVMSTFAEAGDVIFSDERNHASLIDGMRLSRASRVVFPHNDVAALERLLGDTPCSGERFVVVESLYSMDGDEAPLARLADICSAAGAHLIVDDAHAVGVRGGSGSGLIEECGVDGAVCLSINTAGKALGVGGAFVAGPEWAIEYLVQRARPFIFSTAAPPALAAALDASLDVVRDEPARRARLRQLARYARLGLRAAGVAVDDGDSHIIPVHIGGNDAAVSVADALRDDGFDVRAIRPPSVAPGTARLRVSINAALDEPTLDRFVSRLVVALKEAGRCSAVSS